MHAAFATSYTGPSGGRIDRFPFIIDVSFDPLSIELPVWHDGFRWVLKRYNTSQNFEVDVLHCPVVARKKGEGLKWGRLAFSMAVLLTMMIGTLAGMYLLVNYLLEQGERDGFEIDDLLAPLPEDRIPLSEKPPLFISQAEVVEFDCRLVWERRASSPVLEGYEGMGAILNISLINDGETRLFVERVFYETGWGSSGSGDVGLYVEPGERRYIRHLNLDIPSPPPNGSKLTYSMHLELLVEGVDTWVRKDSVNFGTSDLKLFSIEDAREAPEYIHNTPYYYDKINDMIKDDEEEIASLLENEGMGGGRFTIQDIVDAYEYVTDSIDYKADPDDDKNEWISPMTCISRGGGDCEDFSVLLASMITGMGGNARVLITSDHAFTSVYIGENDAVLQDIEKRFGISIPFQILEDELGKWLIIEPQPNLIFGWFPSDVHVQDRAMENSYLYGVDGLGWGYENSDVVYIVDIYI